jgi:hypothetical protein
MERKPPVPVCKAFLLCRQINGDTLTLIGQSNCFVNRCFPGSLQLAFFARLRGGHGSYTIEVQLQDDSGQVVWRDGPPQRWTPISPLDTLNLSLNLLPVFPAPGHYFFVLTANGEELDRESFSARMVSENPAR